MEEMSTSLLAIRANLPKSSESLLIFGSGIALGTFSSFIFYRFFYLSRREKETTDGCASSTDHTSTTANNIDNYSTDCIYLDYNATTPIYAEVQPVIIQQMSKFGNPSSSHIFSRPSKETMTLAREQVGLLVNAPNSAESIYFTSCGTESDNRAVDIALHHFHCTSSENEKGTIIPRVVTSSIEHPAILLYLVHLETLGKIRLVMIPVDKEGFVNPDDIAKILTKDVALVSIMHSNNEVGTLQPIREIATIVRNFNSKVYGSRVLFHSDGAQSIGKVPVDVEMLGVDMFTVVGHKFGAPKGVAALYVRPAITLSPMLIGGGQERGVRGGTESVLLIAALGEASRLALTETHDLLLQMLQLKKLLIEGLLAEVARLQSVPGKKHFFSGSNFIKFNGPARSCDAMALASDISMIRMILSKEQGSSCSTTSAPNTSAPFAEVSDLSPTKRKGKGSALFRPGFLVDQLPNTVSVSFRGVRASKLIALLSDKVACSAGSACHSSAAGDTLSSVLSAMGVPPEHGLGTLRLSLGRMTTQQEIDRAVKSIGQALLDLAPTL